MIETSANPIRSRIDTRRTGRAIKRILADGTPAWVSHPRDFKQWAREVYLADKEASDKQVSGYRIEGQDLLTDHKARMVNPISTRDFIQRLRDNGVKCFTYQTQPEPGQKIPASMVNTTGLWCAIPGHETITCVNDGLQHKGEAQGYFYNGAAHEYVTWLDIPFMFEWSVLRLDAHQLPIGEKYRGWRSVVSELVKMKVFSEKKAHQIFGEPNGRRSLFYRQRLFNYRNGRYKLNEPRATEASA